MRDNELDFKIARLGECRIPSPMSRVRFTRDDERVLYHATLDGAKAWLEGSGTSPSMEAAGPREMVFFDPAKLACGIVTCGGQEPAEMADYLEELGVGILFAIGGDGTLRGAEAGPLPSTGSSRR